MVYNPNQKEVDKLFNEKDIPKLPYGQGSITIFNDKYLAYKKVIKLPNGKSIRKTVYGETPRKCMDKMNETEKELFKQHKSANKAILLDGMMDWLENVHKQTIKPQSYQRLVTTINGQIANSDIGHMRYQSINSSDIQEMINNLNLLNYSHSTIKKTYDVLNMFYRYASAKDNFKNPMVLVNMPRISNINAEVKEVQWFDKDDINRFIAAAGTTYANGRLKFKYGYVLAANIYLGLRGGELLALQWKDIDFDKRTIYVCKTLIEYRENGKTFYKIQQSTKRDKNRYVPVNDKALELLTNHKKYSQFTDPDDFVISTSGRKTNSLKHLSDVIGLIENEGETTVRAKNTHILRHTCASLYFRAGVSIEVICKILGNTREVCEKTYVHFVEEQLQNAASQSIKAINFD